VYSQSISVYTLSIHQMASESRNTYSEILMLLVPFYGSVHKLNIDIEPPMSNVFNIFISSYDVSPFKELHNGEF